MSPDRKRVSGELLPWPAAAPRRVLPCCGCTMWGPSARRCEWRLHSGELHDLCSDRGIQGSRSPGHTAQPDSSGQPSQSACASASACNWRLMTRIPLGNKCISGSSKPEGASGSMQLKAAEPAGPDDRLRAFTPGKIFCCRSTATCGPWSTGMTCLLTTWRECSDERAVLSVYPNGFQQPCCLQTSTLPEMAAAGFDAYGILKLRGISRFQLPEEQPDRPHPRGIYRRRIPVRPGLNRERRALRPRALLLWRRDCHVGTAVDFGFQHLRPESPAAVSSLQDRTYRARACSHPLERSQQLARLQPSRTQTCTHTARQSQQRTGINPLPE